MKHLGIALVVCLFLSGCATPSTDSGVSASGTVPEENAKQPLDFVVSAQSADTSYGFSEANPVKVGGVDAGPRMERHFLNQLAGPKGEPIRYQRLGSCCSFKTPHGFMGTGLLDQYQVWIGADPVPKILYLNMYDFEAPKVPAGFTVKGG